MYWNHRVVKVANGGEDFCYVLAEVFYDDKTNKPMCWSDAALVGDTPEELAEVVARMTEALKTPVLLKGQSATLAFNENGTFGYICSLHPGMKGTIEVTQ